MTGCPYPMESCTCPIPAALATAITEAVFAAPLGRPFARKGGRRPEWPYVPCLDFADHDAPHGGHTTQIKGLAYATRDEALRAAEAHLAGVRVSLARRLAEPRHRALREQYGLPREIERHHR